VSLQSGQSIGPYSVTEELLATEFDEFNAAISPDGNWFAYQSNASGREEVCVRPFPDASAGQILISTNGGTRPAWAPDGRELFYVNDNQLFAVPVETDPAFSRGTPTLLIDGGFILDAADQGRKYDVHPSNDRFLMVKPQRAASDKSAALNVVLNWFEELEERVPAN
jgi:serine/threonine-protein kinase